MNIFNDVMNGLSCFLNPDFTDSFFNFNYNFNMIIDYDEVTGKLYKYGRFFNITELFRYNFIFNTLIPKLIPLSIFKEPKFVKLLFLKDRIEFPILARLILFMENTYSENFTFDDAYQKITNKFKNNNNLNSLELTLFMLIMGNYIEFYSEYKFIIPGVYTPWDILINKDYPNNYIVPFCYNITDDYNEVKNIFYKKNPDGTFSYDSSNEALFIRLNGKLNDITIKQCMTDDDRFTFIIPQIIYEFILLCFFKFGTDIKNYTKQQQTLLYTSFFLNTNDSRFSTQNSILESITNLE
jgi:hypothetical protein